MKINTKITAFFIVGFFLVSLSLGLISIFSLLNNQKDNLLVSKNELLEASRELVQENANFFFRFLDKELREFPSLTTQDILKIINEIVEPSPTSDTVIMDIKNRALLAGYDQPEISALLDRRTVERYLGEMVLTRNKDFYLDNYDKFRADKKGLVIPASAHLEFMIPLD